MQDKVAVVTGGASGLGAAIAKTLVKHNVAVNVLDVDAEKLAHLDENFITHCVDVTDYAQVQKTIDAIVKECGAIDILVNNAGCIYSKPVVNIMSPENMKHSYNDFQRILELNLNSVFITGSIVIEKMVRLRTKGVIINISSISARGNAGQTAYAAGKAGVNAITKVWAKELGPFGIRSIAIAPGFINTESTRQALNEKTLDHIIKNTPLRKLGEVKNITKAVMYAIENDFVNGEILEVNGGLVI